MYRDSQQSPSTGNASYTYSLSSTLLSAAGSGFSILSSSLASANKALTAGAHQLAAAGESPKGDRERVEFLKFAWLQHDTHASAPKRQQRLTLLIGYQTGFQVWDIQDGSKMEELVSRRDGPVRFGPLPPSPPPPLQSLHLLTQQKNKYSQCDPCDSHGEHSQKCERKACFRRGCDWLPVSCTGFIHAFAVCTGMTSGSQILSLVMVSKSEPDLHRHLLCCHQKCFRWTCVLAQGQDAQFCIAAK